MRGNQPETAVYHLILPCLLCAHLFSMYPTSLTLVTEGYQHVLLRVEGQVADGLGVSIDYFSLLLCHLSRLGIHCVQPDREGLVGGNGTVMDRYKHLYHTTNRDFIQDFLVGGGRSFCGALQQRHA